MNQYSYALVDAGAGGLDAPTARTICRALANLLSGCAAFSVQSDLMDATGGGVPRAKLTVTTPFRLPTSLEPATDNGNATAYLGAAGLVAYACRSMTDSRFSKELTNVDKPSVNRGDLIVAWVLTANDVSDQLDEMQTIVFTNGYLVIGQANTDQEEGVYQTPFVDAVAYAVVGAPVAAIRQAELTKAIANAATATKSKPVKKVVGGLLGKKMYL